MYNITPFSTGWAQHQLQLLDGAERGRRRRGSRIGAHPAARLVALLESVTPCRREGFRALIADHLDSAGETPAHYVRTHPRVFLEWCYGVREMPSWAARVIAGGALALLISGRIPPPHRDEARALIHEVLADVAGGVASLRWLLSMVATLNDPVYIDAVGDTLVAGQSAELSPKSVDK